MKKANFNLILGVFLAFAVCMMTSCNKIDDITNPTKYGRIQGIVTNYTTNEPLQGVNISLSPSGLSAVTGSDGRYEFNDIEVGQYTVQGMKTGFETNTKSIVVTEEAVASGDMQLRTATTGFNLSVEYLDFGNHFNTLTFKIINASATTPMSWEIFESLNWLTVTPNTGNLQGGQEVTLTVTIDRTLIHQNTTGNITIHTADMEKILPVSVSL